MHGCHVRLLGIGREACLVPNLGGTISASDAGRDSVQYRHRLAAQHQFVGKTTGRGKKSRVHAQIIPVKDIWLYPLLPAAKELQLSALRLNPLRQDRAYGSTECLHAK